MEVKVKLAPDLDSPELFGPADKYLRKLRGSMGLRITVRDAVVTITGDPEKARKAGDIIGRMQKRLMKRGLLTEADVDEIISQAKNQIKPSKDESIIVFGHRGVIEPFTRGQLDYIRTIQKNDLTLCTGPAGTGKTYLAVAAAVSMLKQKLVRKVILARPAVEAGEKLGFLPGDLQAKVNPYLRPLFDALEEMMDFGQMRKFMEMDIIEIIPLAFMRGRTLNEAAIICDEAQNTSPSQMLMLLTRLGRGSKMIITGDITQVDLEKGKPSGMVDAWRTLKGIDGVGFVQLGKTDIVRHSLVQNIVQAYDKKKTDQNSKQD
ncbi:PhoH-like protein [Anaerohalosphaera lusitana]|uniref:PhoH-like protein n=1 Tax=Anaerohalosphaera lusitana TaxID=1936003 RepID=A0A1U9NIR9_9BACT|nr:PhoH family protein [Anaerohalosphaera lusitana]AQT67624.1 PhoH-like protein [Anaerohalosphaera lusitana]